MPFLSFNAFVSYFQSKNTRYMAVKTHDVCTATVLLIKNIIVIIGCTVNNITIHNRM